MVVFLRDVSPEAVITGVKGRGVSVYPFATFVPKIGEVHLQLGTPAPSGQVRGHSDQPLLAALHQWTQAITRCWTQQISSCTDRARP